MRQVHLLCRLCVPAFKTDVIFKIDVIWIDTIFAIAFYVDVFFHTDSKSILSSVFFKIFGHKLNKNSWMISWVEKHICIRVLVPWIFLFPTIVLSISKWITIQSFYRAYWCKLWFFSVSVSCWPKTDSNPLVIFIKSSFIIDFKACITSILTWCLNCLGFHAKKSSITVKISWVFLPFWIKYSPLIIPTCPKRKCETVAVRDIIYIFIIIKHINWSSSIISVCVILAYR